MGNDSTIQPTPEMARFQEWLRSKEGNDPEKGCFPLLKEVAKSVIRWGRDHRGTIRQELRDVFQHDEYVGISTDTTEKEYSSGAHYTDGIVSSVVTFIWEFLNNPNRLKDCRIQLAEYLATNNLNGIRSVLVDRVINYCRDEARKASNSPFHACYRKMSTAISKESQLSGSQYQYDFIDNLGSFYAISLKKPLRLLLEGKLSINKFMGWPRPDYSTFEIMRSAVLLDTSRIFWIHSLEVIPQFEELDEPEYLLSIKELVEYIDTMYGLEKPEVLEQAVQNYDGDDLPAYAETSLKRHEHDPFDAQTKQLPNQQELISHNLLISKLVPLAEAMVVKWKPNRRKCYYLRYYCDLTLEKIAPLVGLGSPQAAQSNIKEAEEAIRQRTMMSGLDREEKLLFFQAVSEIILKYHPECRDGLKGESPSNG